MRNLVIILAALALPGLAHAESDYTDDGEAYCTFAKGVANSQTALLVTPQLFLDTGQVNGNDITSGSGGITSAPPTTRLTFGVRYSLIQGLVQGIVNRQRAGADCDRYRAASGLARFLVENREQVSPSALDAK